MAHLSENTLAGRSESSEIRLSDYVGILTENWRLIGAIITCALFFGGTYAMLAQPIYRANATILIDDGGANTNRALGDLASLFNTKTLADTEIELIRSSGVVGATVHDLHLDIEAKPRYFPVIGAWLARRHGEAQLASPMFGLSSFAWGGERIAVSRFDLPKSRHGEQFVLTAGHDGEFTVRGADGEIVIQGKVGQDLGGATPGGDVQFRVDTLVANPGTQFLLAQASTQAAVAHIQRTLSVAERTKQSGVIDIGLEGADPKQTADIVNSIAQEYIKQNDSRQSAEAEHSLSFVSGQLPALREQLDEAEQRYNSFRQDHGTVDLSEEGRMMLQQIVDGKTKLADLEQQRSTLMLRFTSAHPQVVALDAQIASLRDQLDTLNKRVVELPATEQTALRLMRDVHVDTDLYTNLLNGAQQLRIAKARQVGNVHVVDFSTVPEIPFKPNRPVIVAMSGLLGTLIAAIFVLLRKSLVGGVERTEDIERAVGVPVFATVPRSKRQERLALTQRRGMEGRHVLALEAPTDAAVEGVRSLRTALQIDLAAARNNVVMVTGSRSGVGKSFLSSNLAAVLATQGKRVLMIDADMRCGDLHSSFNVVSRMGLSDVLAGANMDEAIVPDVMPRVDLLTGGSFAENPADLLHSERMKAILEHYSAHYDFVVVDTPPVLAVTDATLIGRHAGTTLLVVRYGRNSVNEVADATRRLRTGRVDVSGVLFTDVPQRRLGYDGYYSDYAYQSKPG